MGRRAALLVGISEYGEGFEPLPGSLKDVQALADVLKDPDLGAFEVQSIEDCDANALRSETEHFFIGKDKEDLLLFYFSGHGDQGARKLTNPQLHFCASDSCKVDGLLFESKALSATFLMNQIDRCRAQRIVVILDCCFSGAIGNLIAKGEEDIHLGALEARGCVILASSSATKVALQERDGLSLYTRYLVEGMKGPAYPNQGQCNWIVAQDLHKYATEKFGIERKSSNLPKIFTPEDTGFDLPIIKAPKPKPELEYRKKAEQLFKRLDQAQYPKFNGLIENKLSRGTLDTLRNRLGLSVDSTEAIEKEIQKPYLARAKRRKEYSNYFMEAISDGTVPDEFDRECLTDIRQNLGLDVQDAQRIEAVITQELNLASSPKQSISVSRKTDQHELPPKDISDHSQEITTDPKYESLEELLQNQQWKEADQETYRLMITIVGRTEGDYFRDKDLKTFPCEDLQTLDRLWIKYSKGKWGFSVQKRIWEECGSPKIYGNDWKKFGERVGWRKKGHWLEHKQLTLDLKKTSDGEFPARCFALVGGLALAGLDWVWVGGGIYTLFSRTDL